MRKILMTLLYGSAASAVLLGQEPPAEENVFELSPFEVTTEASSGYLATNTLAGTRINAELKDFGAAVSVYTEDFLQDIDATSVEEILTYTTSTEGGGQQGNYAGYTDSTDGVRGDPSGVNRIRALSEATRTRDFFESDIPTDTYNFTNLTISRGPNAILAGMGAPGGVIDSALKQANFKDSGQIRFRFGSNSSHREELHVNQVLVKDVLAIRLDALNEDRNFDQKPTYEKDQRLYLAGKWNMREAKRGAFWGRTTVRANVEVGSIEGIPPNPLTPIMATMSWFEGIDPRDGEPYASPKWYADGAQRKLYNADGTVATNADLIQGFPLYRQWNLVFADPGSETPLVGLSDPALAGVQGFMGTIPTGGGAPGGYVRGSGDQNRNRAGYYPRYLKDRNIFDFYDHLLTGKFDSRSQSFDATDIRLEQLLMGGKAGFEIAYNLQHFETFRDFPFGGGGDLPIYIDTTKFLSVRTDAFNTTPKGSIQSQLIENPNFGRPFIVARDAFRDQSNATERESMQVTAFLRHDFAESASGWKRWLGRHTLSTLFFETDWYRTNRTFISTWDPNGELSLIDSTGNVPGSFPAQVNAWFYIGDSMVDVATEDQMRLKPITSGRPQYGETYTLRVWDNKQKKFVTGTSTPLRVLGTARDQLDRISSQAFALHSHWLKEHLVTLIGWRKDSDKSFTSIDPERLPDGNLDMSQFAILPAVSEVEETLTKSVVLNLPEALTFGNNVRVFWNESGNFNPVGQRRNQWNEELGSPTATTEEYGVGLALLQGKLDIRVNRFETQIENAGVGGVGNAYSYTSSLITRMLAARDLGLIPADEGYDHPSFVTFEDVARAFYESIPDRLKQNIGPEYNFNPRFVDSGGVLMWEPDNIVGKASVSDVVSKGVEIEIVYNPTRNWRMSLSIAKNEGIKANVAAAELAYAAAWRQNLETLYDGSLLRGARNPGTEASTIWGQYQNETLGDIQTANALSGTASPEIRKWRANFVTRYEFRDGWMDGYNIGCAVRWQDQVGIGYPYIQDDNGNTVADIRNPYYGPETLQMDLSMGYKRKIRAFGQKMDWAIALNIGNLIADDDLIPVTANADGTYGSVRIPPYRTWFITNTFTF